MKKIFWVATLAALLTGLAFLAGCGGCGYDEKKPVATIDGKNVVTVGDFVYHYKRAVEMAPFQNKPVINTFEDAKDFLDDIITSRVLEMEADKLGYGKEANVIKEVEGFRSNLLRERSRRKLEEGIKVTEADILDFYNKNKEWRRVSYLVTDDKKTVEAAYAELAKGAKWDDVVAKYSLDEQTKKTGGQVPQDFTYGGDNASRAVYATPVGKYTPVVASENGDMYFIFRVDKKVPGQKDEYAKVKDSIRDSIKQYKLDVKTREMVAKWRKEAKIVRDPEMYNGMYDKPIPELAAKYNRKRAAVSRVGTVPVYFDTWYEGAFLQLGVNENTMELRRKENPAAFKKIMDDRLRIFEDQALSEWAALRDGEDKKEDFIREVNKFRAGMMVDILYEKVFLPTIPAVTEEEITRYFDAHKAEFQEPERAAVFLVALPDKAKSDELYAKVKAGAPIETVVGEYMKAFNDEMMKKGPPKEQPAESSMPVADFVNINRQPTAPAPGSPPGSGGEPPIIAEIRAKVFAAKVGDLSAPFRLKDGRWAFFKYFEYYPLVQHTLAEPQVQDKAKELARNEKMASPATDRKCQAWFQTLRDKHKVVIDEGALKMAFKKAQKL